MSRATKYEKKFIKTLFVVAMLTCSWDAHGIYVVTKRKWRIVSFIVIKFLFCVRLVYTLASFRLDLFLGERKAMTPTLMLDLMWLVGDVTNVWFGLWVWMEGPSFLTVLNTVHCFYDSTGMFHLTCTLYIGDATS